MLRFLRIKHTYYSKCFAPAVEAFASRMLQGQCSMSHFLWKGSVDSAVFTFVIGYAGLKRWVILLWSEVHQGTRPRAKDTLLRVFDLNRTLLLVCASARVIVMSDSDLEGDAGYVGGQMKFVLILIDYPVLVSKSQLPKVKERKKIAVQKR
jgi:hypothetical protein